MYARRVIGQSAKEDGTLRSKYRTQWHDPIPSCDSVVGRPQRQSPGGRVSRAHRTKRMTLGCSASSDPTGEEYSIHQVADEKAPTLQTTAVA
jgi:hypothetical protein